MTFYEFTAPLVLLAIAMGGVVYIHFAEKRLVRKLREQRSHPAE
ncbi:hypothetical protein SAMN04488012_10994 [Palleronia salina]|mgnify:CR=1 FL=1|uniref:Heme exporter protein D n=2 Tax=Palleronia TaxID=315422 RepID=A0A1M6JB91_9RHOB|nr:MULTISPECIES: hypothetical protein [Palleronia]SEN95971.1 hypothetical protein SAMN04488011_108124 [Palleronia pelagia]SHJ43940.1 hypothetical protein SAMN04488012_10994 [Palleronia salina]